MKLVLGSIVLRMPEPHALSIVWQELLLHEVALIGMGILVILPIAQLRHEFGGRIAQMQRHRQVARLPHIVQR